jgi:hypothetical protein
MARQEAEPETVYGEIKFSTPKAVLFKSIMMEKEVWIPRSQIEEMEQEDDLWMLKVKAWFVKKEGLE